MRAVIKKLLIIGLLAQGGSLLAGDMTSPGRAQQIVAIPMRGAKIAFEQAGRFLGAIQSKGNQLIVTGPSGVSVVISGLVIETIMEHLVNDHVGRLNGLTDEERLDLRYREILRQRSKAVFLLGAHLAITKNDYRMLTAAMILFVICNTRINLDTDSLKQAVDDGFKELIKAFNESSEKFHENFEERSERFLKIFAEIREIARGFRVFKW